MRQFDQDLYIEERDLPAVILSTTEDRIRGEFRRAIAPIRARLQRNEASARGAELSNRSIKRHLAKQAGRGPQTAFERDVALIRRDGISSGEARQILRQRPREGIQLSLDSDAAPLSRKAQRVADTIRQMVRS